jgi:hypothetical protein
MYAIHQGARFQGCGGANLDKAGVVPRAVRQILDYLEVVPKERYILTATFAGVLLVPTDMLLAGFQIHCKVKQGARCSLACAYRYVHASMINAKASC